MGHSVFPQNGNYTLAENATSPIAALPKCVRPTLGLVFEVEQNGLMGESCILPVSVRVIQVRLACVSQDEP